MMRWLVTALILLGAPILDAAASATAVSSDALDADLNNGARSDSPTISAAPTDSVTEVRSVAAPAAPARVPSANPLWAVPLSQLPDTRERPIFSPSRRPPPVAAAANAAPVKPPSPKTVLRPPQLSLVGTIAGQDESFGIFLDQSTKTALRLKVGEDYQGWKLQTIRGREATLEKDEHAAVMTLPDPGNSASGSIRLIPVSEIKTPMARQQ